MLEGSWFKQSDRTSGSLSHRLKRNPNQSFMAIPHSSLFILKLLAAIGCGLVAGVFFAFLTFVMNALARLQPKDGIAAMQSYQRLSN
ncbi:MAG: hypothetical protein JOZ78_05520 [Chroococcidiopsidaceae cyanobacterium CP_BM_ER_R8_30]|nr:hypothetical protein [Chroococcidiopsidaceae cyanobacterium CP_BM_ER_R8_30]